MGACFGGVLCEALWGVDLQGPPGKLQGVQYVGESYHEYVGMLYHQNLYVKQSIGAHSRVATNTAVSAVAYILLFCNLLPNLPTNESLHSNTTYVQ